MRPIPTAAHGAVDVLFAGACAALPALVPASPRATRLLRGAAGGVLGLSLLTRYELGVLPVVPMRGHLAADAALNAAFVAAPRLLPDEDPRLTRLLAMGGVGGALVGLLTRREPARVGLRR